MKPDTADFFQKTFGFKDGIMQKYFAPIVGKDALFHVLCLNLPKSVGEVKLRSKNPHEKLYIDPNYLDHDDDVKSVMEGKGSSRSLLLVDRINCNLNVHIFNH